MTVEVDVDSFIAVGKDLPFADQVVAVHSVPVIRKTAPLAVHNHVYVDVLLPRTPYAIGHDDGAGPVPGVKRTEWYSHQFKLSQVPHMEFATWQAGAALLLFFPHMIHRPVGSTYWATNIPSEIKLLFYRRVFYPAILRVKPRSEDQYVKYSPTLAQHQSGKGVKPKAWYFVGPQFRLLMLEMRKIVRTTQSTEVDVTDSLTIDRIGTNNRIGPIRWFLLRVYSQRHQRDDKGIGVHAVGTSGSDEGFL